MKIIYRDKAYWSDVNVNESFWYCSDTSVLTINCDKEKAWRFGGLLHHPHIAAYQDTHAGAIYKEWYCYNKFLSHKYSNDI